MVIRHSHLWTPSSASSESPCLPPCCWRATTEVWFQQQEHNCGRSSSSNWPNSHPAEYATWLRVSGELNVALYKTSVTELKKAEEPRGQRSDCRAGWGTWQCSSATLGPLLATVQFWAAQVNASSERVAHCGMFPMRSEGSDSVMAASLHFSEMPHCCRNRAEL